MAITSTNNTKEIDDMFNFDLSHYEDSMMRAYTVKYKLAFA